MGMPFSREHFFISVAIPTQVASVSLKTTLTVWETLVSQPQQSHQQWQSGTQTSDLFFQHLQYE